MRGKCRAKTAPTLLPAARPEGIIERVVGPIYNLPCWNAQSGYGSSLTFEFGTPRLEIREPQQLEEGADERRKAYHAKRHISLRGQWHLWIHCCNWEAYSNGAFLSDSDTKEGMQVAVDMLDGQKLMSVVVNQPHGHTLFEFDLGGRLMTEPDPDHGNDPRDLWLLFESSRKVLCFREDGLYSYQYGNTPPSKTRWKEFEVVRHDSL